MAKDVNDLKVYQEALHLIPSLYELTNKLPVSENDLRFQLQRASKSIPANMAEGFAKTSSHKEFKRYLLIALGSSDEVLSHLQIMRLILPQFNNEAEILYEKFKILSKRINSLHKNWRI